MARKADQDPGTTATADENFFDMLLTKGTEVDKTTAGSLQTVQIPDGIREQVARLNESGKALVLPITDEGQFELLRSVYIPAAQAIGRSATVSKSYNTVKGADGQVIDKTWAATRVSIGEKRGRTAGTANGGAVGTFTPEQVKEAAHEIHRGW